MTWLGLDVRAALLVAMAMGGLAPVPAQQMDWTFVDEDRNGREIPVDFRFNPDLDNVVPLVVLAHGFAMGPQDYDDLAEMMVAAGFVVALLGTETGLAPSHADYGLDLVFVADHASLEVGGAVQGMLNGDAALVGHSMGGGAAWLAASGMGNALGAVVGWAPAETAPSAVAAAGAIVAPTLVFSGTSDAITPPAQHHVPLYEGLGGTDCRAFVSLEGGGHCGFADAGTLCDFGELGFNGMPRPQQQAHTAALTIGWLQAHLLGDAGALASMEAYAAEEEEVSLGLDCTTTGVWPMPGAMGVTVHPNPARDLLHVCGAAGRAFDQATAWTPMGHRVTRWGLRPGQPFDVSGLAPGAYFLVLEGPGLRQVIRFVRMP